MHRKRDFLVYFFWLLLNFLRTIILNVFFGLVCFVLFVLFFFGVACLESLSLFEIQHLLKG